MRYPLLSLLLLPLLFPARPALADDERLPPSVALREAHALRRRPERRFDALHRALEALDGFEALRDAGGQAEAAYLAGMLLEERDLANWYQGEHPNRPSGLDPSIEFLTLADRLFTAAHDAMGGVKTAFELGNAELLLGDSTLACGFFRDSRDRLDALRAAQPGVEITILTPERRDLREVIAESLKRYCE